MKYKVNILPTAWEDLKKIEDYYLVEFGYSTAMKVSDHILDTLERLEKNPESGSLTHDEWLNERGYRLIICEKQVAIYKMIDDEIFIYHIADTRSDYVKLFKRSEDFSE